MPTPKLLVFAGSARKDSLNKKLAAAVAQLAKEAGAEVTELDLADFPLPIFDEETESAAGLPGHARTLKDLFRAHDGFLVCCPEYNSSITPLLKNTIDWLSRPCEGEPTLACFRGKVAGVLAAAPGPLGGLRGLVHVRAILSSIGVFVVPSQHALGNAGQAFAPDGSLADPAQTDRVRGVVAETLRLAGSLREPAGSQSE